MQNISFSGLRGFRSEANVRNLTKLTQYYGFSFVKNFKKASEQINADSSCYDEDVFLRTDEFGGLSIVNKDGDEEYASVELRMPECKPADEDMENICSENLSELAYSTREQLEVKLAMKELNKMIDLYA